MRTHPALQKALCGCLASEFQLQAAFNVTQDQQIREASGFFENILAQPLRISHLIASFVEYDPSRTYDLRGHLR